MLGNDGRRGRLDRLMINGYHSIESSRGCFHQFKMKGQIEFKTNRDIPKPRE